MRSYAGWGRLSSIDYIEIYNLYIYYIYIIKRERDYGYFTFGYAYGSYPTSLSLSKDDYTYIIRIL